MAVKRKTNPKLQARRERLKLRAEVTQLQEQKEAILDKLRDKRQQLRNMRDR